MNLPKLSPYIKITRPELAFMDLTLPIACAFLAAFVGSGGFPDIFLFFKAIFGAYFAIIGSYVLNDFFDVDVDLINLPDRSLPSGELKKHNALFFSILLYLLSILLFLSINLESTLVVLLAIIIITSYSGYFKRKTPLSFVPVGLAYGLVPLGVWLAFSEISLPVILFSLMIGITDLGFTNLDASRDVYGDKKSNIPTLPVTLGIPFVSKFVLVCWIIGIILSILIWYAAGLFYLYLACAILSGAWYLARYREFLHNPTARLGEKLFFNASSYRGFLFVALIIDIIVTYTF
ncbi:MAG: UbiA family prenyltransferase [Halobacteriota archaeon]|nr:UbiA family prenyltransferase [Halobacteriota archaeon]